MVLRLFSCEQGIWKENRSIPLVRLREGPPFPSEPCGGGSGGGENVSLAQVSLVRQPFSPGCALHVRSTVFHEAARTTNIEHNVDLFRKNTLHLRVVATPYP